MNLFDQPFVDKVQNKNKQVKIKNSSISWYSPPLCKVQWQEQKDTHLQQKTTIIHLLLKEGKDLEPFVQAMYCRVPARRGLRRTALAPGQH